MKKGFTLIELLAVIVILAIIALIAIPTLSSVIERARLGAVRDSVYGMIDAAELAYAMDDEDTLNGIITFSCNGSKCTTPSGKILKFKGTVPSNGEISVSKDSSDAFNITIGKYCAIGSKKDLTVVKGDCAGLYDANNKKIVSWDELVNKYHVSVEEDFITDEVVNKNTENNLASNNGYWQVSSDGNNLNGSFISQYDKHGYESLAYVIANNEKFSNVTKVILPNGIKKIGNAALAGLNNDSNRTLGCSSFGAGSKVTDIIIPSTVKKIGGYSLAYNENLKELIIPEGVEEIDEHAFNFQGTIQVSNIEKLYIPSSIKKYNSNEHFFNVSEIHIGSDLGDKKLFSASSIKKLYLTNAEYIKNFEGNFINLEDLQIDSGIIPANAFSNSKSLTSLELGDNVTEVQSSAFISSNIKSLKINAVKIGTAAFYDNQIEELVLGDKVTSIGDCAFCKNKLPKVRIDNNIKELNKTAFSDNTIGEMYINISNIPNNMFSGYKINSLIVGKQVQTVGTQSFVSAGISKLIIEDGINEINTGAFMFNNISELTLAKTITKIKSQAFLSNKIKKVVIPKTVKTIEPTSFAANPLENAVFEDKTGWRVNGTKTVYNEDGTCKKDSNGYCMTEPVDIKNIDLSDPALNAKYLSSDYTNCTWTNES